jgi:hypothetical protein
MGWGRSDARQEFPAMRAADMTWPMNRAGVYQASLFLSTSKIRYILSGFSMASYRRGFRARASSRFLLWTPAKAIDSGPGEFSVRRPKYKQRNLLRDCTGGQKATRKEITGSPNGGSKSSGPLAVQWRCEYE